MRKKYSAIRKMLSTWAVMLIAASMPSGVLAQNWPAKPIRLVVSFPPGSSPDVIGRAVAPGLSQALGQTVIVDNRSGVTGMIGGDIVAKSPPDGYTLLLTAGSSMAITVHTLDKLPFDPEADLAPVAAAARIDLFWWRGRTLHTRTSPGF